MNKDPLPDRTPPDTWETDRSDEFKQHSRGLVKAYDGTLYPDPDKNSLRFNNRAQYIRFLHHKTGTPINELQAKYERETS